MDNSCIAEIVVYLYTYSIDNHGSAELQYSGKIQMQKRPALFLNLQSSSIFKNCTLLLTRTQEKKSEDMFLFKIANKEEPP